MSDTKPKLPVRKGPRRSAIVAAWIGAAVILAASGMATVTLYQSSQRVDAADPRGMVWIPANRYLVGSTVPSPGDLKARWMQVPGFAIDINPVSVDGLLQFVQTHRETRSFGWQPHNAIPAATIAHDVPLALAQQFCRARNARLPTEAEWDIAARGTDGRTFPWGNAAWTKHTVDISPFGVRTMVSGGPEWLGTPIVASPTGFAIVRGRVSGNSAVGPINQRHAVAPSDRALLQKIGFRCAAPHTTSALASTTTTRIIATTSSAARSKTPHSQRRGQRSVP